MTQLSLLTAQTPLTQEDRETGNRSDTINFRSVAGEALKKLRGERGKRHLPGEISIPASSREIPTGQQISTGKTVGVRFHLKNVNYDLLPIELPAGHRGDSCEQDVETNEHESAPTSAGLRFCWTRSQSAATEEFINWTRTHGETRGTLTNLSGSLAEFESDVKVPSGSRWYARAISESGVEVDLTGIVSSSSRMNDTKWQVTCRLSCQPSEAELTSLRTA
ncbi:MAG: hypothetical protein KDA68_03370 [Planctomycetaceae bacterium]|nr:hypothetical protein [Planctomycetaceae bacterium]